MSTTTAGMPTPGRPQVEVGLSREDPAAPVISLAGELDLAGVDAAKSGMEPYLANRPARVTFDLEKLTFMDSSGIALLVEIGQRRRRSAIDPRVADRAPRHRGQRAPEALRSPMTARSRFDTSRESIRAARTFATRVIGDAPVEVRESVAVMVSELSTNALVHAASCFDVVVDISDSAVTVAVTDWGRARQSCNRPTPPNLMAAGSGSSRRWRMSGG